MREDRLLPMLLAKVTSAITARIMRMSSDAFSFHHFDKCLIRMVAQRSSQSIAGIMFVLWALGWAVGSASLGLFHSQGISGTAQGAYLVCRLLRKEKPKGK